MIELTRLSGIPLVVNSELIQYIESSPDTTLTLIHGEKLVVRESMLDVIRLTAAYRARLMGEAARYNLGTPLAVASALCAAGAKPASSADEIEPDTSAALRRRGTKV
jgi:flagellar protein FlbD